MSKGANVVVVALALLALKPVRAAPLNGTTSTAQVRPAESIAADFS